MPLALLSLPLLAQAPQQPPPTPSSDDEVGQTIVLAPRSAQPATTTAASTQVITAQQLAQTGERSLPRAIAKATGLFVQETNLGGGAPILRGVIGNQILIVIDGVRLNDSTTRGGPNQSLNGVDPAAVERVEVIRGPNSVLYGSDALGGVILIWTKNQAPLGPRAAEGAEGPPPSTMHAGWDAEYKSVYDGWNGSLYYAGATEKNGWFAAGGLHDWSDVESGDGVVPNTGFHGQSWFGSWQHALSSEQSLRVTASRTRDFDVPRTDRLNAGFGQTQPSDAEHLFKVQDRERYQLTYTDERSGFADSMQARLSLRKYLEERQLRGLTSSTRRLEADDTETVGLGADWRKALGDSQLLTWGFDADFDDVDSTRDNVNINTGVVTPGPGAFAPRSEFLSTGVFVQDEIFAFEPFDVTVGARYSYFEFEFEDTANDTTERGDFDAFTGNLSVGRALSEGVRLVGTVASAFRAPNLADVARTATFAGGTELPNPDLDPEEAFYQELALDVKREGWNAALGVYRNDIQETIGRLLVSDPDGIPGTGDEIYQRVNAGDAEYYGIEARGQVRLGPSDSPWLAGAYVEYTRGEFGDTLDPTTGGPLQDVPATRVPPLHGNVSLRYEPAAGPARLRSLNGLGLGWVELSLWWASSQDRLSPFDLVDARIDPNGTDGWVRVDLDLGGPLGPAEHGASWRLGLHNLADEDYRIHGSGFDSPGFGVVAGISVRH
jgi:hemoglobin/transferrin/lactoferrin receptor protein